MSGRRQFAVDQTLAQSPEDSERHLLLGTLLQWALRALLIVFIAGTLLFAPPTSNRSLCAIILVAYVVTVGCWSVWALRPTVRSVVHTKNLVTLLMLSADIGVVSTLSILTGFTAAQDWTSDVLRYGLFLIPLIAAAQLSPYISGAIAVPTVLALVATSWITQSPNEEPWASIVLSTIALAGLAAGSVALSRIQRSKVEMIGRLAQQRKELLEELLGLEKREHQALAERVHDGALQYVLVARQDLDDVRSGLNGAADRVETALAEASQLLRDVARELHPEVLAQRGLKSAIIDLAGSVAARPDLAVEVDTSTWSDDESTDADYVLYGATREILTNAVKHARAHKICIELAREGEMALLRISDDGVGISSGALTRSVEDGHIGLASIRTKVLASRGYFDVRASSPGTEITISVPLRQGEPGPEPSPQATILVAHPG